jgi:CRP/FNR family cyclic AMP-dependent transcriptional regulator
MTSMVQSPEQLYGLLGRCGETRSFSAGDVIFEQGEPGDNMYVVHEGSVALKDGNRVVDTVGAPGLFGEMALIERDPRALTATADTDVNWLKSGSDSSGCWSKRRRALRISL